MVTEYIIGVTKWSILASLQDIETRRILPSLNMCISGAVTNGILLVIIYPELERDVGSCLYESDISQEFGLTGDVTIESCMREGPQGPGL